MIYPTLKKKKKKKKKKDKKTFDLMKKAAQYQTCTKSTLLSCFKKWEPSDKLSIVMLDNKEEILPSTMTSPLDILCRVFGCHSLSKKLNHLDIATQCEYLKMNSMDTQQKHKQFINKVSQNIHSRIHFNHVVSKYHQNIAELSLYDVLEWTP
eukprot:383989_1